MNGAPMAAGSSDRVSSAIASPPNPSDPQSQNRWVTCRLMTGLPVATGYQRDGDLGSGTGLDGGGTVGGAAVRVPPVAGIGAGRG